MIKNEVYGFDTLVKANNYDYSNRWKPLSIYIISKFFDNSNLASMPINIKKNIAYNYQYLEYLSYQIQELNLNSAIEVSIYKNYIIIGSSIIEAIFYCLLKQHDMVSKSDLELILSTKSNEKKCGNSTIVIETNIYKKCNPVEIEMNFDTMIKKIEAKKLLNISHSVFPYIKNFKRLRNRVHLHVSDADASTDWWAFSKYDFLLMRSVLYEILIDKNINAQENNYKILYFLKLSDEERMSLFNYLVND